MYLKPVDLLDRNVLDRWKKELKDYMIDYNSLYFENEIAKGLAICGIYFVKLIQLHLYSM